MSNQSRPRNPRRVVAGILAGMRDDVKILRARWDPSGITEVFDRDNVKEPWRKREPGEYPENRVEDWNHLVRWAEHLERSARILGDYARRRRDEQKRADLSEGGQS